MLDISKINKKELAKEINDAVNAKPTEDEREELEDFKIKLLELSGVN